MASVRTGRRRSAARRSRPGGLRSYDLRLGFGTAGLEAGLDAKDVSILMGHSSTRITQDTYQHVSASRKRDAAERIGGALLAARTVPEPKGPGSESY